MALMESPVTLWAAVQKSPSAKWLPVALLALAVSLVGAFGVDAIGLRSRLLNTAKEVPSCLIVGVVFGLLPILICLVQTVTRKRLQSKLDSVQSFPIAKTVYYVAAKSSINSINPATLNADYVAPFIILFLLNAFGFTLIYAVYPDLDNFKAANLILGGMQILHAGLDDSARQTYQAGTFVVMALAFVGSYVYMVGRLIERLSNNDLYPISLYFYVVRAVIAIIAAAVIRHTADSFGMQSASLLILLGFITGLAPDLFIVAMARKAFQTVKVLGSKNDPPTTVRPTALPLIMIDDLTRDKVDRLSELGIDSAQVLACQNPFVIWLKLPYDLGLIVDWIASAQLYTLVKENTLQKLRNIGVLTIFDLRCRLDNTDAAKQVCKEIGVASTASSALIVQLDCAPCFVRLRQVRDAMVMTP